MFIEKLNPICEPLRLEHFEGFEEKFNAITLSLKISAIFCQVKNSKDISLHPNKLRSLYVEAILIPGGHISLTRHSLNEWNANLISDLNDYIYEQSDFITAQQNLKKWQKICRLEYKKNNPSDRLNYGWGLEFKCCFDNLWVNKDFGELILGDDCAWEISDHFEVRKSFFSDMDDVFEAAYQNLTELADLDTKPYEWYSEHKELEVAELIDSIIKHRLIINKEKGGSPVKFRHLFYSLLGVNEKYHEARLQHLRKRDSGTSIFETLKGNSFNEQTPNIQKIDHSRP